MKRSYHIILFVLLLLSGASFAQDPHFTQYQAVPHLVNPAFTGVFSGKVRMSANTRQQWSGMSSLFRTTIASVDTKLFDEAGYYQNPFNVGVVFQSDRTLKGALTNNAITLNAAYHVPLDADGYKSIGIGLSGTYAKRNFNLSNLSAGSQFTSGGFDLSLPSGEIALEGMKPYFSVGAGILYCNTNREDGSYFEIGAAAHHVNNPVQTFLYQGADIVPMRISAHTHMQRYISDDLIFDARLLYQSQSGTDYLLSGIAFTKLLEEDAEGTSVGFGCWYRTGDAVAPYVFGEYQSIRFGLTYDVHINNIRTAAAPATSIECSLQYRIKYK